MTDSPGATRTLTGTVVDLRSGAPLPGALVHAAGRTDRVRTDSAGAFTLVAPAELLAVVAGAEGYGPCWAIPGDGPLRLALEPGATPHADYPRPDMDRRSGSAWCSLNGTWSLDFDPDDVGLGEAWPRAHEYPHWVVVPFAPNSLAGVGEQARASDECYASQFAEQRGVFWYRRTFTVPTDFDPARRTIVRFGAVEWHATVFCDGASCGEHDGGYTPFDVDLGLLAPGSAHELVVRAVVPDNSEDTPYPQGKQTWWYTDTGGIWQPVWLEQADEVRISRLRITPELEFAGERVLAARARIEVTASGAAVTVRLRAPGPPPAAPDTVDGFVRPVEPVPGAEIACVSINVHNGHGSATVDIAGPLLWEPGAPWLYVADAEIHEAAGTDRVRTFFGLRSFGRAWAPGQSPAEAGSPDGQYQYLTLNNRPIQLRSVLDQGFTPWGGYTYTGLYSGAELDGGSVAEPRKGSILFDLVLSRQLGFNSARMHIKINDPRYYHWADVLGLLVWYDFPNFGYRGYAPTACRLFEETLRAAMDRDHNHPSIVLWSVINEAWGVGGMTGRMRTHQHTRPWIARMTTLTKELAGPGRLVVDNSPCCENYHASEDTDVLDFHGYHANWRKWRAVVDRYARSTFPGSAYNMESGLVQRGQPLVNSEFGPWSGGAEMDQDVAVPFRYTVELFRSRAKLGGYLFTELSDVEWEWNGWASYDRTLQIPGYLDAAGRHRGPAAVHGDDVLLVDGPPVHPVAAGEWMRVRVLASVFSRVVLRDVRLQWTVVGTDRLGAPLPQASWQRRSAAVRRYTVSDLGELEFAVPGGLTAGRLVLQLWAGDECVAEGQTALVAEPADVTESTVELPLTPDAVIGAWPQGSARDGSVLLGYGDGEYRWEVPVPVVPADADTLQLVLEASAQRPPLPRTRHPQTAQRVFPTVLTATVDGAGARTVELPDAPADARGVLATGTGDPGRYGYRLVLGFDAAAVRDAPRLGVRLRASAGGLAVFGAGAGRYGFTPRLVFSRGGVTGADSSTVDTGERYPPAADVISAGAGLTSHLVPGEPVAGETSTMTVLVVNDETVPVHAVRGELLAPPGWLVHPEPAPDVLKLLPGAAAAWRYRVTPDDPRAAVRTRAYADGPRGPVVTERTWRL